MLSVPVAATARKARRGYVSVTRAEQARQTRRRVIDAAARLFVRHGYAATTIRSIAVEAEVSVPTVELLFGTKPQLLHVVIDVAIAGDDAPVPMLSREWAAHAQSTSTVEDFLAAVTPVLGQAQLRSAGALLAAYEAAAGDPELQAVIKDREAQRQATATWIVDGMTARAPLRPGLDRATAIDVVWLLMDPVLFTRLTRQRGWNPEAYETWIADSLQRLLIDIDRKDRP
jgi:TetR/AcrR family transcriptional regulator, regulator of autoinduction and epiphytic fitness